MAATRDAVIVIDMEDEDEEDKDVKIEMKAMTDAEDDHGDTDTVIDILDERVADTVIDMKDDDDTDAGDHTEGQDRTGIGTDGDRQREAVQDIDKEDRTGIGTEEDREGEAEVKAEEEGQDEAADDDEDEEDDDEEEEEEEEEEAGFAMQVAMELWEHLRDLLEDFTAHGFNHLFRRERDGRYNWRKIVAWSLAIFVAYFASTYYTIASVQEADRNPITTAVGYFPVDEVRSDRKINSTY